MIGFFKKMFAAWMIHFDEQEFNHHYKLVDECVIKI